MNQNAAFSEVLSEAFSGALSKQPGIVRRKDTINNATGAFLQVASLLGTTAVGLPIWASAILAVIIGVVQILFTATTEGPITPSQEKKLLREVVNIDRPEMKHASTLNTLLNIFDAVEIEREKERKGRDAVSEDRKPEDRTVDIKDSPAPSTVLEDIRNQVADNIS